MIVQIASPQPHCLRGTGAGVGQHVHEEAEGAIAGLSGGDECMDLGVGQDDVACFLRVRQAS